MQTLISLHQIWFKSRKDCIDLLAEWNSIVIRALVPDLDDAPNGTGAIIVPAANSMWREAQDFDTIRNRCLEECASVGGQGSRIIRRARKPIRPFQVRARVVV